MNKRPLFSHASNRSIIPRGLRPGDLVVSKTSGKISSLMRRVTGSPESRSLICLDNDRVIEAAKDGVEERLLTEALADATSVEVYRNPDIDPGNTLTILVNALMQHDAGHGDPTNLLTVLGDALMQHDAGHGDPTNVLIVLSKTLSATETDGNISPQTLHPVPELGITTDTGMVSADTVEALSDQRDSVANSESRVVADDGQPSGLPDDQALNSGTDSFQDSAVNHQSKPLLDHVNPASNPAPGNEVDTMWTQGLPNHNLSDFDAVDPGGTNCTS